MSAASPGDAGFPHGVALPAPDRAGLGWRHPHYRALLAERPALGFIEVHSENFLAAGTAARAVLMAGRALYPVSLHGVGLSLGAVRPPDRAHLDRLADLVLAVQPALVSEHAAYARGVVDGRRVHANDLLPIPFTAAALASLVSQVQQVQERLGRTIAIENVSAYLRPPGADELAAPEVEAGFLHELTRRSGCQLLVDVNNLVVNALNAARRGLAVDVLDHGRRWLAQIPPDCVAEIHLAGHDASGPVVIDHHGAAVPPLVWQLYEAALEAFGPRPTLVEWDNHIPPLDTLLAQVRAADQRLAARAATAHPAAAAPTQRPAWTLRSADGSADGLSPSLHGTAAGSGAEIDVLQDGLLQALTAPDLDSAVHTLATWPGTPAEQAAGLQVYRHNTRGLARRCLAAAFPVCAALLGESAFGRLAWDFRVAWPPAEGDLARWGGDLPGWLDAVAAGTATGIEAGTTAGAAGPPELQGLLAELPYLADVARLEWALHRAEAGLDAVPAPAQSPGRGGLTEPAAAGLPPGLDLLASHDPAELQLVLAAGCVLVTSAYPIHGIWAAHQDDPVETGEADARLVDVAQDGVADLLAGAAQAQSAAQVVPGASGLDEPAEPTDPADPAGASPDLESARRRAVALQAVAAAWRADPRPT
ncbi:MAG: hypothetical protein RL722_1780, partial [Pseudomonadota bacterium]